MKEYSLFFFKQNCTVSHNLYFYFHFVQSNTKSQQATKFLNSRTVDDLVCKAVDMAT